MMKYWMAAILILLTGCGNSPEKSALRTANSLLQENQFRAAMEMVESCLSQHPESRELLRLRVLILLKQERFDTAAAALRSLPAGDPVLTQALRHRDPSVRSGAARLIAEQSLPIDCRDLLRRLDDSEPTVRRHCARALGQKKRGCAAVKPLFRLLHDDDWFVRAEAAKALGEIGDPRAAGWLVLLLSDSDGFVSFTAATALRQVACPANHDLLRTAYQKASTGQEFNIAVALAKLQEPMVVETLTGAVKSPEVDQRRRAAEALGDYASADVTNSLVRLTNDPDPTVQEQATRSLLKVLKGIGVPTANAEEPSLTRITTESATAPSSAGR